MKASPCRFNPYKNRGIFKIRRNADKFKGVTYESKIDVPDTPLSYSPTGAIKRVTPMALIIPATVRSKKLVHLNFLNSFLMVTQTSFPPITGTFLILSDPCKNQCRSLAAFIINNSPIDILSNILYHKHTQFSHFFLKAGIAAQEVRYKPL